MSFFEVHKEPRRTPEGPRGTHRGVASVFLAREGGGVGSFPGSNIPIERCNADGRICFRPPAFRLSVAINGANSGDYLWAGITCEGGATIILKGANTVKGFYEDHPGIYVPLLV